MFKHVSKDWKVSDQEAHSTYGIETEVHLFQLHARRGKRDKARF